MRGIEAFLEVLAGAGCRHVFGNPGSTELPLNEAIAGDDRFRYVLGLQEVPVVAMADGYALASGEVGVACVHICCGLGNSMGMLYNAWREGSPLVLVAGQQDRRLRLTDPVLEGDTVSVARPWTKLALEVQRVEDIPLATRRAVQVALSHPRGPVFLSLPVDVQLEEREGLDVRPPAVPDRRTRPSAEGLSRAAAILAEAENPVVLAGSRVTDAGASEELARVAERLGAPVFSESSTFHGRLPMRSDHPLYGGALPLWAPDIRRLLEGHDAALAVGINLFCLYIYFEPGNPLPEGCRLVHLEPSASEVSKNYPAEVGLVGDLKSGLDELDRLLADAMSDEGRRAAEERTKRWADKRRIERAELASRLEAEGAERPMTPLVFMDALARALPDDVAIVQEAPTTHQHVLERLGVVKRPDGLFAHRGWALGWGLGCALGVKLAWPERPVVALLGDGASLYGIQGLWTAAHYHIPVVFVVANNAQYRILKRCGELMGLERVAAGCDMEITDPAVDFVGLARSFGVEALRVAEPQAVSETLAEALRRSEPLLIEVPVAR